MSEFTFEMNSARKDALVNAKITKESPVVEVFSAMVKGQELGRFGAKADHAVEYIKNLGERSANGDMSAVAELNQIRRFVIEPLVLEEARMLEVFGGYQHVGMDDKIEREVYDYVGGASRFQALGGDVPVATLERTVYPVASETISGGLMVDYRKTAAGNLEDENYAMQMVRTQIMNNASAYVVKKIYEALKNATGVKYTAESAGLTKAGVDAVIAKVRRMGPTSLVGAYAAVSQLNQFAGWSDGTHFGISDEAMNEIMRNGVLGMYNGSRVREVPTYVDYHKLTADGKDFKAIIPEGLLFVLPAGRRSPVATWTRGGLTTFTGNDVATGKIITRFDLELACDVAKGHEHEIGLVNDTNLSTELG